jgi:hypothetical protein
MGGKVRLKQLTEKYPRPEGVLAGTSEDYTFSEEIWWGRSGKEKERKENQASL